MAEKVDRQWIVAGEDKRLIAADSEEDKQWIVVGVEDRE